jgi:hypothetical protein
MSHPAVPVVMAITSFASAIMQGQAQEEMLDAQESALQDEKKYLAQQRVFLEEARGEELELFQEQTRELLGVQEVSFARAGIEMSGSALRVLRETAEDAIDEERRINRQFDQYRTMSEMKADSLNRQIGGIREMRSTIPLTTGVSAIAGGLGGYAAGSRISKRNKIKPGGRG